MATIADAFRSGLGAGTDYYNNRIIKEQARRYPELLGQDIESKILANTHAGQVNDWYAPLQKANIGLLGAHTGNINMNTKLAPYHTAAGLGAIPQLVAGGNFLNNFGMLGGFPGGGEGGQGGAPQPSGIGPSGIPLRPEVAAQQGGMNNGIAAPPGSIQGLMGLQLKNLMAAAGKDPRFGSARGGQGGTFVDPMTGKVTSSDTGTQSTRDQKTIAGLDNVNSYLKEAMQKLPQFQTAKAQAKVGMQGLANRFLGTDYRAPSEQATGEAAVLEAAEGFINGFGLNATNENVEKAVKIMSPKKGESANGYKMRVASQLESFKQQQERAAKRLREGTDITPEHQAHLATLTDDDLTRIANGG